MPSIREEVSTGVLQVPVPGGMPGPNASPTRTESPAAPKPRKKLGAFAQAQPFGFGIDLIDAEPQFGG